MSEFSRKDLYISIRSVVLHVPAMANIAQSLIGDLERIAVANPAGVQGVRPTLPAIKYSVKMK